MKVHDHVSGEKVRFSSDAVPNHQVIAGVAIQLFSLGIPCIYCGTEQALAGPERSARDGVLTDYGRHQDANGQVDMGSDKYLREALFGPSHPVLPNGLSNPGLPGFGPFGTMGKHCFDTNFPVFQRIAALIEVRQSFPVARYGRQYQRPISNFEAKFAPQTGGELITWSRILDDEELLCIVNGNGANLRGGDVLVAPELNRTGTVFEVVANTPQAASGGTYAGPHPVGQTISVAYRGGIPFISIRDLPPAEVLILTNRPG